MQCFLYWETGVFVIHGKVRGTKESEDFRDGGTLEII